MNCRILALVATVPATLCLLSACSGPPDTNGPIQDISCVYSFDNINQPEERERIFSAVRAKAESSSMTPNEVPASPQFEIKFVAQNVKALDELDGELRFIKNNDVVQQVLNARNPLFSIHYDTIGLTGALSTNVSFTVDKGAKLYYKPQGGDEQDITDKVGEDGSVKFSTMIGKGQDFIYARANYQNVDRFIKIDVHTGTMFYINKQDYP